MSDLASRLTRYVKALRADRSPGAGTLPIPSEDDKLTSEIVLLFIGANDRDRRTIANAFSDEHSFAFLAFAERMAAHAVRIKSRSALFEGLAALILDGGKFDIREDILVMAPLYDAALKLHLDAAKIFADAAGLLESEVAEVLCSFPHREDYLKSLSSMGYFESKDQDGFRYERV